MYKVTSYLFVFLSVATAITIVATFYDSFFVRSFDVIAWSDEEEDYIDLGTYLDSND
jgi:hypothetical protein